MIRSPAAAHRDKRIQPADRPPCGRGVRSCAAGRLKDGLGRGGSALVARADADPAYRLELLAGLALSLLDELMVRHRGNTAAVCLTSSPCPRLARPPTLGSGRCRSLLLSPTTLSPIGAAVSADRTRQATP